ncbi:hypothetical protein RFI_23539 [Reticulomyxa filosa]|uniref:Uncharacterized protein n=1 Tax=Reticulomyxa filosa TaxID=46433 RepID=X6MIY0_RETFI|nr:hypothetical protein RFI_23539 [Reticulomyxa filosa]|eukprot:ETO13829.1 hypothetical protein RFI_23539 [Reticulomyxa filosa]
MGIYKIVVHKTYRVKYTSKCNQKQTKQVKKQQLLLIMTPPRIVKILVCTAKIMRKETIDKAMKTNTAKIVKKEDEQMEDQIDKQMIIDQLREQLSVIETNYNQLLQELQNRIDQIDEQNKQLQKLNEDLSKKENKIDNNNNSNNDNSHSKNINTNNINNNNKISIINNQGNTMKSKIAMFGWIFNSYINFKDLKQCLLSWGIPMQETGRIRFHTYSNGTRKFIIIEIKNIQKAEEFLLIIRKKISEKMVKGITWAEIYKENGVKIDKEINRNFYIPKWNNQINSQQGKH